MIDSAPCAPRPTLAWLRSEPSSLHDDGLTRSPAERGLKDCDRADGAPAACFVAGRGGSARRRQRWKRCQAPFRDERRARHRARDLSTRRGAGWSLPAQCRTRHAPVSARSPRARDVGWGWPHLQSRSGRVRVSGEARLLMWRPGAPAFWVGLWGRASRLPISLAAGGVACPRGGGAFREVGSSPRGMASRSAGLLVRRGGFRGRPSVAPSARSREGDGRGLRPRRWGAGGLPRCGSRCTGAVCREGCPPRHCSGSGWYGEGSQEQCQGRHAPKGARSPRAREVARSARDQQPMSP